MHRYCISTTRLGACAIHAVSIPFRIVKVFYDVFPSQTMADGTTSCTLRRKGISEKPSSHLHVHLLSTCPCRYPMSGTCVGVPSPVSTSPSVSRVSTMYVNVYVHTYVHMYVQELHHQPCLAAYPVYTILYLCEALSSLFVLDMWLKSLGRVLRGDYLVCSW
jgi:hypothetical protein